MHARVTAVLVAPTERDHLPRTLDALRGADPPARLPRRRRRRLERRHGRPARRRRIRPASSRPPARLQLRHGRLARPRGRASSRRPRTSGCGCSLTTRAPDPDALAALLAAVEVNPSVAAAGPKQMEWETPTTSPSSARRSRASAPRVPLVETRTRPGPARSHERRARRRGGRHARAPHRLERARRLRPRPADRRQRPRLLDPGAPRRPPRHRRARGADRDRRRRLAGPGTLDEGRARGANGRPPAEPRSCTAGSSTRPPFAVRLPLALARAAGRGRARSSSWCASSPAPSAASSPAAFRTAFAVAHRRGAAKDPARTQEGRLEHDRPAAHSGRRGAPAPLPACETRPHAARGARGALDDLQFITGGGAAIVADRRRARRVVCSSPVRRAGALDGSVPAALEHDPGGLWATSATAGATSASASSGPPTRSPTCSSILGLDHVLVAVARDRRPLPRSRCRSPRWRPGSARRKLTDPRRAARLRRRALGARAAVPRLARRRADRRDPRPPAAAVARARRALCGAVVVGVGHRFAPVRRLIAVAPRRSGPLCS